MAHWRTAIWRAAVGGCWIGWIAGTLLVLIFLIFLAGEEPVRFPDLTAAEKLQFTALGAICLGLMTAWKWQGPGGLLALAGFVLLAALSPKNAAVPLFDAAGAIAALHLLCWWRLRGGRPPGLAPWRVPKGVWGGAGGTVAVFLFLCANEILGRPPMMTPQLRPSADLAGTWTQTEPFSVTLIVHADATVTGAVDSSVLSGAHIRFGRSWFGRLLHWNADYVISGSLGARDFSWPLMSRDHELAGSLFLDGRPKELKLRRM